MRYRRSYADCSFGQVHVTVRADRTASGRQPVVLMNSRGRSALRILDLLPDEYFGLQVDIPGMGQSSPPTAGASMADVAGVVAAALDSQSAASAHFFAVHTGHKVAAAFAQRYPQRAGRLFLVGKTHSLIPDRDARNAAMAAQVARRYPDIAVMTTEGRYVDDADQQKGFEDIFKANYGFDFAGALAECQAPTMILEITTPEEDAIHGRQAEKLVGRMKNARALAIAEIEPTGLDNYIGTQKMADTLLGFLRG